MFKWYYKYVNRYLIRYHETCVDINFYKYIIYVAIALVLVTSNAPSIKQIIMGGERPNVRININLKGVIILYSFVFEIAEKFFRDFIF